MLKIFWDITCHWDCSSRVFKVLCTDQAAPLNFTTRSKVEFVVRLCQFVFRIARSIAVFKSKGLILRILETRLSNCGHWEYHNCCVPPKIRRGMPVVRSN